MLCRNCHKNLASVRYAEVVDGKVSDLHLCQDCLAARAESVSTGFEFATPSPFLGKKKDRPAGKTREGHQTCTACTTSLQEIVDTGNVGCSVCYESFPAELEGLLEGIHIALTHRGKVPRLDDARVRVRSDLQSKRALLKTALSMENYEEAASLRDEIRALEIGLGASEAGAGAGAFGRVHAENNNRREGQPRTTSAEYLTGSSRTAARRAPAVSQSSIGAGTGLYAQSGSGPVRADWKVGGLLGWHGH